jgi:hypothetical protein
VKVISPNCHLSVKNYRFPDNLPRCKGISANQFSRIKWRGIRRSLFPFSPSLFSQTPRVVHQDIWEMRQEMPENGRIFDISQIYLLQIWERNTRFQHDSREDVTHAREKGKRIFQEKEEGNKE